MTFRELEKLVLANGWRRRRYIESSCAVSTEASGLEIVHAFFWKEKIEMISGYPACFNKEKSGGYSVIFPDLNHLATCGDTLD